MDETDPEPIGELTMRLPAMPADANANGDIFGGWVMAQMDLAAGTRAAERARGRVATAAVNGLSFKKPVNIGDVLCVYTHIEKIGRTSMTLSIEAWAKSRTRPKRTKVTEATFIMVSIDETGRPTPIPPEDDDA